MNDSKLIAVTVLDKEYSIKCPISQVAELKDAVAYFNQKLQAISANDNETRAILAALNLTNDYLQLKKQRNQEVNSITLLQKKIENSLAKTQQIAL